MKSYPDTIIFDPYTSDFVNQTSGETFQGGRLMNALPHIDGLMLEATYLQANSANLLLTRNGKGDWSLNRTAAGAETYYIRCTLGDILRTGETYNYGDFPGTNKTSSPPAPPKGIQVLDMFAVLNIGVVALTSATLRLGSSVYPLSGAAAAAVVQADLVAATGIATATNAANAYLTSKVAVPTPTFAATDMMLEEVELAIVMAATGTVQIAGLGAHVAFNYN